MPLNVRVLFGQPQHEIASLLRSNLAASTAAWIAIGFATVEGLEAIAPALLAAPNRLQALIVGAGTYRAYETLDTLAARGVPNNRLLVHLGHTRPMGNRGFQHYHPMFHSKIYYLEMAGDRAVAFIGSHNLSGFALLGKNGEASVMLEGPANDPEFDKIRTHISRAQRQSVAYTPDMKAALTWWFSTFVNGLWSKVNDRPDDSEAKKTIVILSAIGGTSIPSKGDVIYFEMPAGLPDIRTLDSEVHIYVFDQLPPSPSAALSSLATAKASLWCRALGLEKKRGGVELQADWEVFNRYSPTLRRTQKPFRPTLAKDMEQVRVEVYQGVFHAYEYLFDGGKETWDPVYDKEDVLRPEEEEQALNARLDLEPREDGDWLLVRKLVPAGPRGSARYLAARRESSPESGSYLLMSSRRVDLSARDGACKKEEVTRK